MFINSRHLSERVLANLTHLKDNILKYRLLNYAILKQSKIIPKS